MTSTLHNLIKMHKEQIYSQDQWVQSPQKQLQKQRYKNIGDKLLEIIVELSIDDDDLAKATGINRSLMKRELCEKLQQKQKVEQDVVSRTLGLFTRDCFEKNEEWNKIKQECQIFIEDYEFEDQDFDDDITEISEISDSAYTQISASSIPKMAGDSNSQFEWDSTSHQGGMSHIKQSGMSKIVNKNPTSVQQHLASLSAPQSQLNYLCQNFGWRNTFRDSIHKDGQFQVTAVVNFQFKKVKEELTESAVAQNKKLGRMFASFKMLKKIYMSFPLIWTTYSKIRSQKSLNLPGNSDISFSILNNSQVIHQKVEMVEVKQPQLIQSTQKQKQQIAAYLSKIKSFKAQMNILQQQIPNTFFHPKMQKIQFNNQWKVKGELHYKHGDFDKCRKYTQVEVNANSKVAEQQVAKKLLTEMYGQQYEIMEIMSVIKNKKSIQT